MFKYWLKELSKLGIKKLFKGLILVGLIYLSFQYAASSQGVLDIGDKKGNSKLKFQEKVITFVKDIPTVVLQYLHINLKKDDTIPDEVMIVYYDLENALKDESVPVESKNVQWRLLKAKEIAEKYGLKNSQVWELYVRVKKEQQNNNI